MWDLITATLLVVATAAFAVLGLRQQAAAHSGLDDYLVARNRYKAPTGAATLLASTFGAWLLFSPAEAATRGGLVALLGYSLGVAAPRLAMIPLGLRMRRLMPHGRSLIEYVRVRYGRGLYLVVLVIMVTYLAVLLAAEATATARLIGAVSDLRPGCRPRSRSAPPWPTPGSVASMRRSSPTVASLRWSCLSCSPLPASAST